MSARWPAAGIKIKAIVGGGSRCFARDEHRGLTDERTASSATVISCEALLVRRNVTNAIGQLVLAVYDLAVAHAPGDIAAS